MGDSQGPRNSKPGAARIRAAESEIESLLCQMVFDSELKVFACRWGSGVLDSGRELCNLTLSFEDKARSLSFDPATCRTANPGSGSITYRS